MLTSGQSGVPFISHAQVTVTIQMAKDDGIQLSIQSCRITDTTLVAQRVKNLPAMPGSIPRSGRFSGEENGNLFQYPCLENSMDRGA